MITSGYARALGGRHKLVRPYGSEVVITLGNAAIGRYCTGQKVNAEKSGLKISTQ